MMFDWTHLCVYTLYIAVCSFWHSSPVDAFMFQTYSQILENKRISERTLWEQDQFWWLRVISQPKLLSFFKLLPCAPAWLQFHSVGFLGAILIRPTPPPLSCIKLNCHMAVFALLVVNFHNRLLGWLISEQPAVSVCFSFEKSIKKQWTRKCWSIQGPSDMWCLTGK